MGKNGLKTAFWGNKPGKTESKSGLEPEKEPF
jgi:hypothetical protein